MSNSIIQSQVKYLLSFLKFIIFVCFFQDQDRHTGETIEYKGHSFVVVAYRMPTQCEACNRPCYNVFSPPPCLECTRCHVRCHKQHYDDREEFMLPCRGKLIFFLIKTKKNENSFVFLKLMINYP
jgi:hypothetical protein